MLVPTQNLRRNISATSSPTVGQRVTQEKELTGHAEKCYIKDRYAQAGARFEVSYTLAHSQKTVQDPVREALNNRSVAHALARGGAWFYEKVSV